MELTSVINQSVMIFSVVPKTPSPEHLSEDLWGFLRNHAFLDFNLNLNG